MTYPDAMYGGPQQTAFVDTIVGLTGINHFKDLNGGTPNCVSITPLASLTVFFFPQYHLHSNFAFDRRSIGTTTIIDPHQQWHI